MQKQKNYSLCINGIDKLVNKDIYQLVEQLKNENAFMTDLLGDAYFLNREFDNVDIISQSKPLCN